MTSPINEARRGLRGAILTIDGSLAQTGWALTDTNGRRIQSGMFRSKSGHGWPADHRIYVIGRQLLELWPKLKAKPLHFGIEHQFFAPPPAPKLGAKSFRLDPETVAALSRLEGVLIFVAKNADPDMDVMIIRAMEWRAQLGVTGKDTKARGVVAVRLLLRKQGVSLLEEDQMEIDEVEACGIGIVVHRELSNGYPMHTRRGELKEEKKARKARAKLPKALCFACHKRMLKPGMMVDHLTRPVEIHLKCRPRPAKGL